MPNLFATPFGMETIQKHLDEMLGDVDEMNKRVRFTCDFPHTNGWQTESTRGWGAKISLRAGTYYIDARVYDFSICFTERGEGGTYSSINFPRFKSINFDPISRLTATGVVVPTAFQFLHCATMPMGDHGYVVGYILANDHTRSVLNMEDFFAVINTGEPCRIINRPSGFAVVLGKNHSMFDAFGHRTRLFSLAKYDSFQKGEIDSLSNFHTQSFWSSQIVPSLMTHGRY